MGTFPPPALRTRRAGFRHRALQWNHAARTRVPGRDQRAGLASRGTWLAPLCRPAGVSGERLDRAIDGLMPRIRITDLLWHVNALTGFLDTFTDLRSGRVHSNPAALLAAILAGATNLGLERMARASSGVSHAQLSWASAWCLRSETYADALARILDAHHALPFASVWGSASRTSSDG